jgi:hypothetical protein
MRSNMEYLNRYYVIFDVTELDEVDFNEVLETSAETVRKSVDGTKTFVKFNGNLPPSVKDLKTRSQKYTHEEILEILAGEDWTPPPDSEISSEE